MSKTLETRGKFSSRLGFVLSAAGSAVGLGNIWRFPYLAARHGGGLFLLVYIILAVFFGFSLMLVEIAMGRKTGSGPLGAFKSINKKGGFIGWMAFLVPVIILPYYCVIGGWVIKYLWVYLTLNANSAASNGYFDGFISSSIQPIFWFLLFIGATT
ncbi:MAG: sodium-dependent transporter, partial [Clostridiales bacterium]|nr:sodium-dependent transporter [Clostridiales bacterium]